MTVIGKIWSLLLTGNSYSNYELNRLAKTSDARTTISHIRKKLADKYGDKVRIADERLPLIGRNGTYKVYWLQFNDEKPTL